MACARSAEPKHQQTAVKGSAIRIAVDGERVSVNERNVEPLPPRRLTRLGWLEEAMTAAANGAHVEAVPYVVDVSDATDGGQLKSVVATLAALGAARGVLDATDRGVEFRSSDKATQRTTPWTWPARALVVMLRAEVVEIWRAPTVSAGSDPPRDDAAELVASVRAPELDQELPRLAATCSVETPCSPAMLYMGNAAPVQSLRKVLAAFWPSKNRAAGERPALKFHAGDAESLEAPPPVEFTGYLPPEVIQSTIRAASYSGIARCYSAALARNPDLSGRIAVRFIIDASGRVKDASIPPHLRLPDDTINECIVSQFESIVFPKPKGGGVHVEYPLQLQPDAGQ
jgi:hypothetical protein